MVRHEFKGGIGSASRVVAAAAGGWTVGVLVQANYGEREHLRVDGVPVGARAAGRPRCPSLTRRRRRSRRRGRPTRRPGRGGAGRRLDHRDRRDRRAAAAAPVRPARAARDARPRPDGEHRQRLVGDLVPRASPRATVGLPTDEPVRTPGDPSMRAWSFDERDDAALPGDRRGHRGRRRERAARRRDADGPRRDHGPCPRPRASARRAGALQPRAAGRKGYRIPGQPEIRPATIDDLRRSARLLRLRQRRTDRGRGYRRAVRPPPHRQPPGAGHAIDGIVVGIGAVVDAVVAAQLSTCSSRLSAWARASAGRC